MDILNLLPIIISTISIFIAAFSCYQSYKISQREIRPYVVLYIVSSKNATYIKIKNVGKTPEKVKKFSTDVDLKVYKSEFEFDFPYVGLENIDIPPNASKIAIFNNSYLNKGHHLTVFYKDINNKSYQYTLDINTYSKYALVHGKDFDLIDY